MIMYDTVDVSVALEDVIVNETPTDLAETLSQPGVPPSTLPVTKIRDVERMFASETVTDPDTRDAVPWRTVVVFEPAVPM